MKISFGNILTIISICVAIFFGVQNTKYKYTMGQIHQEAQSIINNNYFTEAPASVKTHVETIAAVSGNTVVFNQKK